MAKNKKYNTPSNPLEIPGNLMKIISWVYFFYMSIVFPLYMQNKYYDMGDAKYTYFKYATIAYVVSMLIIGVFWLIIHIYSIKWKQVVKSMTGIDKFVLAYLAAVTLSYLFSDYKSDILWGYPGWYMGLVSQVLFVGIYFCISRSIFWRDPLLLVMLIPSSLVFVVGVLNRFNLDPLQLYTGLSALDRVLFLSTIGQATWYSSYLCLILPIGMYLFWYSHAKFQAYKGLLGVYCSIGFASLVTQNSDSAFIGIGLVFLLLFYCSFESNLQFKYFLQLVFLCLLTMRVIGFFQMLFPEHVPQLEALSFFLSKNPLLWPLIILLALFYVWFCRWDNCKKGNVAKWKPYRNLCVILFFAAIILMVLLICAVTQDMIPQSLSFLKESNYLNFNEDWGNRRGSTWMYAVSMFREYPWKMKLFGCGPDGFASYSYPLHQEYLNSRWGTAVLTNAHNEWLNCLVTLGIVGVVTYVGIFVSTVILFVKARKQVPLLLAFAGCMLSYAGHNLFCYQQAVATPILFLLLGIGGYLYRGFLKHPEL